MRYSINLHYFTSSTIVAIIVGYILLTIVYTGSKASFADSINPGVFALDSEPYDVSYEDWTIKFWQWLLPIPEDRNPMTDTTGEHCGEGQNSTSPVFFLVFSGGGSAVRTCDVPAGKAIFIPINVVECSYAEFPGAKTEEELHTCAEEDESSNPGLFLSVDGREFKNLEKYRVHSRAFNVSFAENNVFATKPGPTRAVSDGYWVLLEPLSPGKHDIHFKASLTNPTTGILFYNDDLKYTINVR
ncbi:MAG TPA: hypothetical protein VFG77_05725 [Nitrososphaeraceae archaeon]|nr:hypothetical protein [Nitrososphaeraceae archaeon]